VHGRPHLSRTRTGRALAALTLTGAALALLGACSDADPGRGPAAAPAATSAACEAALAAAPATVLGAPPSATDVPGALAYGSPAVLARCGLAALAPTAQDCLTIDDVDWVLLVDGDPFVFATYGRDPVLEVRVPASTGRENASGALVDLAPVARALPSNGRSCVG